MPATGAFAIATPLTCRSRVQPIAIASDALTYRLRPAARAADGAIVLLHGRGTDEHDLFPLLDFFDPGGNLVGLTARAPLSLPPGGQHWYQSVRVGFPHKKTFDQTYEMVTRWLDALIEVTGFGPDKTILGGFSQGAVMSYALGLGRDRPAPAGLIALSGFMPEVEGFELDLPGHEQMPVAIGHGSADPVIPVQYGRDARDRLEAHGYAVTYCEYPLPHTIDPGFLQQLRPWLSAALD